MFPFDGKEKECYSIGFLPVDRPSESNKVILEYGKLLIERNLNVAIIDLSHIDYLSIKRLKSISLPIYIFKNSCWQKEFVTLNCSFNENSNIVAALTHSLYNFFRQYDISLVQFDSFSNNDNCINFTNIITHWFSVMKFGEAKKDVYEKALNAINNMDTNIVISNQFINNTGKGNL